MSVETDVADIKEACGVIIETLGALHETTKLILEACKGDGSGELVQVLRQLVDGVTTVSSKMDALPTVLKDELDLD